MANVLETTQKPASLMAKVVRESTRPAGLLRVMNLAMARLQAHRQWAYCPAMPTSAAIEVTNSCSGSCVLCPVGQCRRSRSWGLLDWDRFRRLIDQLCPFVTFVGLYNWGEPLLHPRIYDMIEHLKARGVSVRISSNLHNFRPEDAGRLVSCGLDGMGVALHGLSDETYRNYQPRHRLADVLDKVRLIVAARKKLGSATPDLRLDFILRKDNEHEATLLPQLAKELGTGYLLEEVSLNLRLLPFDQAMQPRNVTEDQLRRERLELMDRWLPADEAKVNAVYRWMRDHGGAMPGPQPKLLPCDSPWHHLIVCWDGDVNLCCGSFAKGDSVGNVFDRTVRQVWNNERFQAARRSIRGRRPPGAPPVLCDQCPGMLM